MASPTTEPSGAVPAGGGDSTTRASTSHERLTVFVATCQFVPDSKEGAASSAGVSVFKSVTFPALVSPSARLAELQSFLMAQWIISKSPLADLPADEQFYTFKGRLLRLDGTLDAYYILDKDTIYLRFASLGKICDPWAMATSELRAELKARKAYDVNLQPEQLRLHELVTKESRMRRLQQATKKEEVEQVQAIAKEPSLLHQQHAPASASVNAKKRQLVAPSERPAERPPSLAHWPFEPCANRTVFLSIAELERTFQLVPRDVLEPALLLFDSERKWVFDKHNALQKRHFDYKYMRFEQDFLEMLALKEEAGLVFWFRVRLHAFPPAHRGLRLMGMPAVQPQKSYEKLSVFLASVEDPAAGGKRYEPLQLKEAKWLTLCGENGWDGHVRHDGRKRNASRLPQFTSSVTRVLSNLQSGSFDYVAVKELLARIQHAQSVTSSAICICLFSPFVFHLR
ncbi:hypothetical protein BBJ28_00012998 [Nothophytophthora sp. Chile5]|nr:hypothetical protein BBJ28_00012998 [Nothophytophthora sp. Chile5]